MFHSSCFQEWGRYTRGCGCILFVVDANAIYLLPDAKKELHRLLEDRELANTPLLGEFTIFHYTQFSQCS